jgi:hypothetical protein
VRELQEHGFERRLARLEEGLFIPSRQDYILPVHSVAICRHLASTKRLAQAITLDCGLFFSTSPHLFPLENDAHLRHHFDEEKKRQAPEQKHCDA